MNELNKNVSQNKLTYTVNQCQKKYLFGCLISIVLSEKEYPSSKQKRQQTKGYMLPVLFVMLTIINFWKLCTQSVFES